ncbi:MAG: hypothetical protein ACPGLV_03605 [Bacteroidia bacterium]
MASKVNQILKQSEFKKVQLVAVSLVLIYVFTLYLNYIPSKLEVADFRNEFVLSNRLSILIIIVLSSVFAFSNYGKILRVSSTFETKHVRIFYRLICFITIWPLITYDYNFFLDTWHIYDRGILLVILIASFRNLLFLVPTLALVLLIQGQFELPVGGAGFLDKRLAFEILKWTVVFALIKVIFHKKNGLVTDNVWFFGSACIASAFYFYSGVAKMQISSNYFNWVTINDVSNNLAAMHARGWLANMPDFFEFRYSLFKITSSLGQLLVFVGELIALVALFSKRLFRLCIGLMLFLHFNVFFMNGALFMGWICCCIFLIKYSAKFFVAFNLDLKTKVLSVILIMVIGQVISIPKLGWFDSKIDNRFELFSETRDNNLKKLSLGSLSPFTINFQKGIMNNCTQAKSVNVGFLMFDEKSYLEIDHLNPTEVKEYLDDNGHNSFNSNACFNLSLILDALRENKHKYARAQKLLKYVQLPEYWNAHTTDGLSNMSPDDHDFLVKFTQNVKLENGTYEQVYSEIIYPKNCFDDSKH